MAHHYLFCPRWAIKGGFFGHFIFHLDYFNSILTLLPAFLPSDVSSTVKVILKWSKNKNKRKRTNKNLKMKANPVTLVLKTIKKTQSPYIGFQGPAWFGPHYLSDLTAYSFLFSLLHSSWTGLHAIFHTCFHFRAHLHLPFSLLEQFAFRDLHGLLFQLIQVFA